MKLESRQRFALFDELLCRDVTHAARADGAARAAGAVSLQRRAGRALLDLHFLERDTERVCDDRSERCFVAVSLRFGDHERGDRATCVELDLDLVHGRVTEAGVLD